MSSHPKVENAHDHNYFIRFTVNRWWIACGPVTLAAIETWLRFFLIFSVRNETKNEMKNFLGQFLRYFYRFLFKKRFFFSVFTILLASKELAKRHLCRHAFVRHSLLCRQIINIKRMRRNNQIIVFILLNS